MESCVITTEQVGQRIRNGIDLLVTWLCRATAYIRPTKSFGEWIRSRLISENPYCFIQCDAHHITAFRAASRSFFAIAIRSSRRLPDMYDQ